jgi:formate dehydrogenase alpha subunit
MIELTIDGKKVQVEDNTTILEAARSLGIYIPTLCYHPKLGPFGACRICLVEIDPGNRLVPACITKVMRNMAVSTQSKRALAARQTNLELLLARHPVDCLVCEKGGECELQQVCFKMGVASGIDQPHNRLVEIFGVQPLDISIDDTRTIIERDLNKCIMCKRCIRICHDVQALGAIQFSRRGFKMEMGTFFGREMDCEFCGQCVDICPVGAIINKMSKYRARVWQLNKVATVCSYCSVGCSLHLNVKDNQLVKVSAETGMGVNDGNLCYKGRYGQVFVNDPARLTTPLIRDQASGELKPASWDEALSLVASRLGAIKEKYGGQSIAGIGSARCTNEDNYLFQKFLRVVIGSNHIDNSGRFEHAASISVLNERLGWPAMSNSLADLNQAEVLLVIGLNPTETHPVLGIGIRRLIREGKSQLILVEPRHTKLARQAKHWLPLKPDTDLALINGMLQVLISEGLVDKDFIQQHTQGLAKLVKSLKKYTPKYVAEATGLKPEQIVEAARLYGEARAACILYGMGVTQHPQAGQIIHGLVNLALASGNLGRPGGGLGPVRGQCNTQGVSDMGVLPDFLPGYQPVDDAQVRSKFEEAWGRPLSSEPGLTLSQMLPAIEQGQIHGLYIMGENRVLAGPNMRRTRELLSRLDFLVVQDLFLNETSGLAQVVLPGVSFAEKQGTYTNTERRVQLLRQALQPIGQSQPCWQIICQLSTRMGYDMAYSSPAQIMEEIARLTPIYGGISYQRLERGGLQWPCPDAEHAGTPILYEQGFPRGRVDFRAVDYTDSPKLTSAAYPYLLVTGKWLFHYHSGELNQWSESLVGVPQSGLAELNPEDAAELGVNDGDWVTLESKWGQISLQAQLNESSPSGMVFVPVHFRQAAANLLLPASPEWEPAIPELKMCAVNIRLGGG